MDKLILKFANSAASAFEMPEVQRGRTRSRPIRLLAAAPAPAILEMATNDRLGGPSHSCPTSARASEMPNFGHSGSRRAPLLAAVPATEMGSNDSPLGTIGHGDGCPCASCTVSAVAPARPSLGLTQSCHAPVVPAYAPAASDSTSG